MNAPDSFEQALVEFTDVLLLRNLPSIQSLLSSGELADFVGPLLSVAALSTFLMAAIDVVKRAPWFLYTLLFCPFAARIKRPYRKRYKAPQRPVRTEASRPQPQPQRPSTNIVEDDDCFETWRKLAAEGIFWKVESAESHAVHRARRILGVNSLAHKHDIRRAYLSLMKHYHPDIHASAPPHAHENLQERVVIIRGAYDLLTRQICKANQ